ncbi:MAG: TolC family protein [Prevotellaceae bacterium]|jgi:outer membrane protein TolC|nr:TolC family protein [Prevotellaceae bacterium]
MMKKIVCSRRRTFIYGYVAALWLACPPLHAQQSVQDVLLSVEKNNATLKALREETAARQLESRTGIFLPNPDVGFNYLWGSPHGAGVRTDVSVRQTFDFATLSGVRRGVADKQQQLFERQYRVERMYTLLEARRRCIDVVYYTALRAVAARKLDDAETLARHGKARLAQGGVSLPAYRKIELTLAAARGDAERIAMERNAALRQLQQLNGGVAVAPYDDRYAAAALPADFEAWFVQTAAQHPALEAADENIALQKKKAALNRTMNLPEFSAGYMSERVTQEAFRGVTFGLSVPLWENKNRTKQAKADVRAAEYRQADVQQQLYAHFKNLYDRATDLQRIAAAYREAVAVADAAALWQKALAAGEISVSDYIVELELYYDIITRLLEAERDFETAAAELQAASL